MSDRRILSLLLVFCLLFTGCSFETVEQHNRKEKTVPVSLEIRCDTVWNHTDLLSDTLRQALPADGVLLSVVETKVAEGASVFELLDSVCADRKLALETTGTGHGVYVKSIAGLREFSVGALSGWQYRVNGSYPDVSCGNYTLQPGDRVIFDFTCDLGKDLQ